VPQNLFIIGHSVKIIGMLKNYLCWHCQINAYGYSRILFHPAEKTRRRFPTALPLYSSDLRTTIIFKLGKYAITVAIASVFVLGACAETRTTESTGTYVDGAAITAKVKTAFLQDPALKVMQINVVTYDNVVQLSGFVDTPAMIAQAGAVARGVEGVASVRNDLIVK